MAAHPLSLEVKFLLTTAISGITSAASLALKHIPNEDADLRDGLTSLMQAADGILKDIVSRAREQ